MNEAIEGFNISQWTVIRGHENGYCKSITKGNVIHTKFKGTYSKRNPL